MGCAEVLGGQIVMGRREKDWLINSRNRDEWWMKGRGMVMKPGQYLMIRTMEMLTHCQ
jgi:hypothetical protein